MGIVFGPINSRRFGKSLGIDLSPFKKQCNFDCLYCELESARTVAQYSEIVSVANILEELQNSLNKYGDIDVITITANGEPTLYPNLKELMEHIDKLKGDRETLILSNGSTIFRDEVQEALLHFDTVKLSLDCATSKCLKRLDRADGSVSIERIKRGMLKFREIFQGKLILEILFVKSLNDKDEEIANLNSFLMELKPYRIDIGTVDRPPAYSVQPLTYEELRNVSLKFSSALPIYITSRKQTPKQATFYTQTQILETLKKRPLTREDMELLFTRASLKIVEKLLERGVLKVAKSGGYNFFVLNG
jgi:wyosine [tRNA(Phe)-imidazoG37] synthetase (radical SAM superfamily)